MKSRNGWLLALVLLSGCPTCSLLEDGPGFYGRVIPAGTQGASTHAPAQVHPLARQAAQALLPRRMGNTVAPVGGLQLPASGPSHQLKKSEPSHLVERWRDGEVIVRAQAPQRASQARLTANVGSTLAREGWKASLSMCNTADLCLWKVQDRSGKALDAASTRRAAALMDRARDVKWAIVNHWMYALAVPNDEYRGLQWHYDQLNLPSAWDVTTGDDNVVAAVIDTGVSTANPDISPRLGQGADLISDTSISNDGDARDNDANDPGDEAAGGGSFHGTHCAGTVGAATNNGIGVAGVSWRGLILPVRVLGVGGGTGFDILGGIQWALGDAVEGVTRNAHPADVLSMSLGAPGDGRGYKDILEDAVGRGVLVFVAAGNDNVDAATFQPANVEVAITVGATGFSGHRASYSNFGSTVDIMAPGGELAEDADHDGYPDGVLSTVKASVDFLQGTSMATPHMAGLGILMKSLQPALTQADARQILRDTARTESNFRCDECGGASVVDAAAVVAALGAAANSPFLSVTPNQVGLGKDENSATINIRNSGVGTMAWTARIQSNEPGWSISPDSGSLDARSSGTLQLSLNRSGREGTATLIITATGLNQERTVNLHYDESVVRKAADVKEAFLAALVKDGDNLAIGKDKNDQELVVAASKDDGFTFKLQPLPKGDYLILGLTDDNGNGKWEDGEGIGLYPDLTQPEFVSLGEDEKKENINFIVRPSFVGGSGCTPNSHDEGGTCKCDDGYVVSPDGTSCVMGGTLNCPPNSHANGNSCECDSGFVVNTAGDACVPG